MQTLDQLQTQYDRLTAEANADEAAVLAGTLDKADYIQRDLERQEDRKRIEMQAQVLRFDLTINGLLGRLNWASPPTNQSLSVGSR